MVTGIAAVVLGFFNFITQKPIERQIREANLQAMKEVMPADTYKEIKAETATGDIVKAVSKAYKNGSEAGFVIKVSPSGYGGSIEMLVGIDKNGKITGIKIISHNETPGLGAKATEPSWQSQFKGKGPDALMVVKHPPSKDKNEVQAITGATITSRAVTKGVNEALREFKELSK